MKSIVQSLILFALAARVMPVVLASPGVLTQDYDIARTGANLAEVILKPGVVSSAKFGRLFSYPVDEQVLAQPLYVPNLSIGGGTHNVVFIATMGNSVFAFDADNPATSTTPLWSTNLGSPVPSSYFFFTGGASHNGIYSTPVIDPNSNTIYVVTHLWSTANQSVALQLHALDLMSGNEKFGGPVQISARGFDANVNGQHAGLLLLNGIVYVAFASHGDFHFNPVTQKQEPYVGMILGYDAQSLTLVGSFNAEVGGEGASIWQGGRGLASDGTYVYAMTANAFKVVTPDYSESFVQLNPGTLSVASYYQDPDAACLNQLDLDLSSSGPQVIPSSGMNLLVGGGKEAKVYILQLDQPLNTQAPSFIWGTSNFPTLPAEGGSCVDPRPHDHGWVQGSDTAFWNRPTGAFYYAFGNFDELISWQVSGSTFTRTSVDTPPNLNPNAIAVSANRGANGILWTVAPQMTGPAVISAYNAIPSGGHLTLLWNSAQLPARDALGQLGRSSVPTVVNGKVYVASASNQVVVYGLLPTTPSIELTASTAILAFAGLNPGTQIIQVNSIAGYTGTVNLTLTGLPPGITYSFAHPSIILTSKFKTVKTNLTVSPGGAVFPLNDNYTVVVQASGTGGITASVPIRLYMRNATFPSASKAGCNSQHQMSANLSWQIDGSDSPSIWIQDPVTPNFPGRLWIHPPPIGSGQTDYSITSHTEHFYYWAIDQSAGLPANFDNALGYINLQPLYNCP